jgi:D-alanine-D-alanine ligase-like ATP-grasp enzyme
VVATTIEETGNNLSSKLSQTSRLIVEEAVLRGVSVQIISAEKGLFILSNGESATYCCSSLTDRTSSVAMNLCLDKSLSHIVLKKYGFCVPDQIIAGVHHVNAAFFSKYSSVVTKPVDKKMGQGVSVDIKSLSEMNRSIKVLRDSGEEKILIEEYVPGLDIRIIVINYCFVAAIHREPPAVVGDGSSTVFQLIVARNNRSHCAGSIPINYETMRCIKAEGYDLHAVLEFGKSIRVRKNTNEHTGATPSDVTDRISPKLRRISEKIALNMHVPVVGIDFMVPRIEGDEYTIIEVNSRPGLDGHEPQPVVTKFLEFLFPESVPMFMS